MKTHLLNLTVRKYNRQSFDTCKSEAETTHTVVLNDLVDVSSVNPSTIGQTATVVLGYNREHLNRTTVFFDTVDLAIEGRNEIMNAWQQLARGDVSFMTLAEMSELSHGDTDFNQDDNQ